MHRLCIVHNCVVVLHGLKMYVLCMSAQSALTDNECACIRPTQQNFPHMDPVHGWEGKPLAESAQFLNICQEEVYY